MLRMWHQCACCAEYASTCSKCICISVSIAAWFTTIWASDWPEGSCQNRICQKKLLRLLPEWLAPKHTWWRSQHLHWQHALLFGHLSGFWNEACRMLDSWWPNTQKRQWLNADRQSCKVNDAARTWIQEQYAWPIQAAHADLQSKFELIKVSADCVQCHLH